MMIYKYRICRDCGQKWNVSRIEPGEKVYVCPLCEWKRRFKTEGKLSK